MIFNEKYEHHATVCIEALSMDILESLTLFTPQHFNFIALLSVCLQDTDCNMQHLNSNMHTSTVS